MLNENAVEVSTGASYSVGRLLREISPLYDISSALMALAVASAALAIVVAVIRSTVDFEDSDGRMMEALSAAVRVLVFVAIIASLGQVAEWALEALEVDGSLKAALAKVR